MSEAKTIAVVIYEGLSIILLTGARKVETGFVKVSVRLTPGKNFVPLSDWQGVNDPKTGSSELPLLKQAGKIKELKPESAAAAKAAEDSASPDISAYNAKDSIELIKNTFDTAELDELEAQERAGKNRSTVVDAAKDQREKLEAKDEEQN